MHAADAANRPLGDVTLRLEPLSDDELRSIASPAAVIVAEKSAPFASRVQAERAHLLPDAEVTVIPGAGHEVSWTHVDECVAQLTRVAVRAATDAHASSSAGTKRSAANTAAS